MWAQSPDSLQHKAIWFQNRLQSENSEIKTVPGKSFINMLMVFGTVLFRRNKHGESETTRRYAAWSAFMTRSERTFPIKYLKNNTYPAV